MSGISIVNSALSEDKALWDPDAFLGTVVVGPPVAPGARVFADGSAGNGSKGGADEILRSRVKRVVVEKIEQLRNSAEALLAREHAGTRQVGGRALANLLCGIVGQDSQKRVNGFRGAEHGQSLDGPKARLQVRIAGIAKKRAQYRGRFDAAIAEGAESPEREVAALRIVMNLVEKLCQALGRFRQVVGSEIDFHSGDAHARIFGVQGRKDEVEEPISVFQMTAPGIEILVNQADRLVGALDGKFEKALGLLLGRHTADGFHVGVSGAGTRPRHCGRGPGKSRRECRSKVKPASRRKFQARGLITKKCGKNGEKSDEQNETGKAIPFLPCARSDALCLRSELRVPGDVYQRFVHGPSACAMQRVLMAS
jgi:hypothetical protein